MGHKLVAWAQRRTDLPPKTKLVLMAMADKTDESRGGYFFKNKRRFLAEDMPDVPSLGALKQHFRILKDRGYITTVRRGGGRGGVSIWTASAYHINAPGVTPSMPEGQEQLKLTLLTLLTPYDRISRTFTNPLPENELGQNNPLPENELGQNNPLPENELGQNNPLLENELGQNNPYQNVSLYKNRRNDLTEDPGQHAAAGGNELGLSDEQSWFEQVCAACAEIGIIGVRPSLFDDLRHDLTQSRQRYGEPTVEMAEWVADEVKYASMRKTIHHPEGFLRNIARQTLIRGGVGVTILPTAKVHRRRDEEPASAPPLPQHQEKPQPSRHDPAASHKWDAILGELQGMVDGTAFETWFKKTYGVEYADDVMVVEVETAFIAEMLEKRMMPMILKTLSKVCRRPTTLELRPYGGGSFLKDYRFVDEALDAG